MRPRRPRWINGLSCRNPRSPVGRVDGSAEVVQTSPAKASLVCCHGCSSGSRIIHIWLALTLVELLTDSGGAVLSDMLILNKYLSPSPIPRSLSSSSSSTPFCSSYITGLHRFHSFYSSNTVRSLIILTFSLSTSPS